MCRRADQGDWVQAWLPARTISGQCDFGRSVLAIHTESLILAQDERWRRA
jgi:hypothetical protein